MLRIESDHKIYYKLHAAGIINQVLSVELGLALGFILRRKVIFTKFICIASSPIAISGNKFENIEKLTAGSHKPLIFDLLNLPLKMFDFGGNKPPIENKNDFGSLVQYYFRAQPTTDVTDEDFFAEGRPHLDIPDETIYFEKDTLAHYSRFFYNRSKELDRFLSTIQFQKEYLDFAENVVKSIGPFRGIHVRLTDHAQIMFTATEDRFQKGLQCFQNDSLPLVICTDDTQGYLNKYKSGTIMLHEYIIENFQNEFRELPYHDLTVFGVVCLLVMSYATEFVGTPGSTYSAYIQRLRINKGLDPRFNFIEDPTHPNDYKKTGMYSWNGSTLHPCTKAWWREWPECKLILD